MEKTKDIVSELKKDNELYYAFQANIAMAFKDEYHRYKKKHNKKCISNADLHIIANDAAKYFLDLWIKN